MPHIHEKYDFVVNCFIVNDGRVLLVKHKKLGHWFPLGGHIELDEDPEQALLREVAEESGLKQEDVEIIPSRPAVPRDDMFHNKFLFTPQFLDVHDITPDHKHICLNFFARTRKKDVTLSKSEHHDIRWFSAAELEDPKYNIRPPIKFLAKEAIRRAED